MDEYDPERLILEQRQADLLCVYREAWEPPLPSWAHLDYRPDYHRGFRKRISITATDFVKRPAALFAATPVSDLEIRNLRHLHVYNNKLKSNSKVFREFADPSRLPNLLVLAREPTTKASPS